MPSFKNLERASAVDWRTIEDACFLNAALTQWRMSNAWCSFGLAGYRISQTHRGLLSRAPPRTEPRGEVERARLGN